MWLATHTTTHLKSKFGYKVNGWKLYESGDVKYTKGSLTLHLQVEGVDPTFHVTI